MANGERFFKICFGLLRRAAQGAGAAILGGVFKKPRFVPVFAPEAFGCGKIGFAVRAAAGAGIERDGEQRCAAGIDFKCKITHAQSVEIIAERLKAVDEVVEIADSAGGVVVFIRDGIRKAAHERGAAVPAVLSEQSERFCGGADMQCVLGDSFNRGFHVALHLFLYGSVCF